MAVGRVQVLKREGQMLAPEAAVDKDGKVTVDANQAGSLIPFGAHKGYGLSLINEIVAGFIGGSLPTIRSRTHGDLVRLKRHYLAEAGEPECDTGTDYPWRLRCEEDGLARAMPRIIADVTYANFKHEVPQTNGPAPAKRYEKAWSSWHLPLINIPEPT